MALKVSNAMADFQLAETVELDCGKFDMVIRQAAIHNEEFKSEVAKRALNSKKKSLVPDSGTLTGSEEQDMELIIDLCFVGWGERPFLDDDGEIVPPTKENLMFIFKETGHPGKVLFAKVQQACLDEKLFVIREEDLGNS